MNIAQIKAFIAGELAPDIEAGEIPNDYELIKHGVIDSLSLVRLIAWTGDTFGVPINDIDLSPDDLSTVTKINDFINCHTQPA